MRNGILQAIDTAIKDPSTPEWGRIMLLCIRDDHAVLHEHIAEHQHTQALLNKILVGVLTVLCVALVTWLLTGRFPTIFG